MSTQQAAMQNGQQNRALNMPCSGMLRPDEDTASSSARANIWGRPQFGSHAKSLVNTRLFAAFRSGQLLSCLERQQPGC